MHTIVTFISVTGRWHAKVMPPDYGDSIFETQWCATETEAIQIASEWCAENKHGYTLA